MTARVPLRDSSALHHSRYESIEKGETPRLGVEVSRMRRVSVEDDRKSISTRLARRLRQPMSDAIGSRNRARHKDRVRWFDNLFNSLMDMVLDSLANLVARVVPACARRGSGPA